MIQSVWKNLTGLQKAAEHLWCDFKCSPWAKNSSPNINEVSKSGKKTCWAPYGMFVKIYLRTYLNVYIFQ